MLISLSPSHEHIVWLTGRENIFKVWITATFSRATNFTNRLKKEVRGNYFHESTSVFSNQFAIRVTIEFPLIFIETNFVEVPKIHKIREMCSPWKRHPMVSFFKITHYTNAHMHACMYSHMHTCTYVHMHVRTHACTHTCTYAHTRMHAPTCAHTHMYTVTHTYMYAQTHLNISLLQLLLLFLHVFIPFLQSLN